MLANEPGDRSSRGFAGHMLSRAWSAVDDLLVSKMKQSQPTARRRSPSTSSVSSANNPEAASAESSINNQSSPATRQSSLSLDQTKAQGSSPLRSDRKTRPDLHISPQAAMDSEVVQVDLAKSPISSRWRAVSTKGTPSAAPAPKRRPSIHDDAEMVAVADSSADGAPPAKRQRTLDSLGFFTAAKRVDPAPRIFWEEDADSGATACSGKLPDVIEIAQTTETSGRAAGRVAGPLGFATVAGGPKDSDTDNADTTAMQEIEGNGRRSRRIKEALEKPSEPIKEVVEETLPKKPKSETPPLVNKPTPKKKKIWLAQGLYCGQDVTSLRGNSKKHKPAKGADSSTYTDRKVLPLPVGRGSRRLEADENFKLPYDVFNCLPSGQPRPEDWKKLKKNVFVGDAAELWRKAKPLPLSKCLCTPESGCDEDCQNRYMMYECEENNCNIGSNYCTNRQFDDLKKRIKSGNPYNVGIEVMPTSHKGFGVRACRSFEPNQIICEYAGEIITPEESERRMREDYKDARNCYLMGFHQGMILDGNRGTIARFVNHSCQPNCRIEKWVVAGQPRMALFAGDAGIFTGDEITYDYNFSPFKDAQECKCGAPACRGVLGPRPTKAAEKAAEKAKSRTDSGASLVAAATTDAGRRAAEKVLAVARSAKRKFGDVLGSWQGDDDEDDDNDAAHPVPSKVRRLDPKASPSKHASVRARLDKRLVKKPVSQKAKLKKLHARLKKEPAKPEPPRAELKFKGLRFPNIAHKMGLACPFPPTVTAGGAVALVTGEDVEAKADGASKARADEARARAKALKINASVATHGPSWRGYVEVAERPETEEDRLNRLREEAEREVAAGVVGVSERGRRESRRLRVGGH